MKIIKPCFATDHMNYIQFATDAWLEGLNYEEYKESAIACNKHVYTEDDYASLCIELQRQEDNYFG